MFCGTGIRMTNGNKRYAMMIVPVKDYNQPVNPMMMSYCITHPSFLRRHSFAWIERSSLTNYAKFTTGYGFVMGFAMREKIQSFLRADKVIGNDGHYLHNYDVASATTIDDIIKLIN